jgi:hypothetical protein
VTLPANEEDKFSVNRVIGNLAKEIVRSLLDESGYRTYPYGYESFLSDVRHSIHIDGSETRGTVERIRSHPDLVVYDDKTGDWRLVEVKYRDLQSTERVGIARRSVRWYQRYWRDSVLLIVLPAGKIFYAQYVRKLPDARLEEHQFIDFNLDSEFLPMRKIFPKVEEKLISGPFAQLAKRISRITDR